MHGTLRKNISLAIVCIAIFPVWNWLFVRYADSSDESFGWLALIFILVKLFKTKSEELYKTTDYVFVSMLLLAYVVCYHQIPMLGRAMLAFSALAVLISRKIYNTSFNLSVWGLLMLALPINATLQFYIGFPLRLLSSKIAGTLLRLSGINISVSGGVIQFGELAVSVDAPCSGVKMLYVTALLVCLISVYNNLSFVKTILLSVSGLLILIVANSLRATWLFFSESSLIFASHKKIIHDITGVVIFLLILFAILGGCKLLERVADSTSNRGNVRQGKPLIKVTFFIICTFALLVQFSEKKSVINSFEIEMPKVWGGKPLTQLPMSDKEQFFLQSFPGRILKATDGTLSFIFRFVKSKTRKLHSASDCFKGLGYKINYQPLEKDKYGTWHVFYATKGNKTKKVKEIIYDKKGRSWSDVSKWYWTAPDAELWTNVVIVN